MTDLQSFIFSIVGGDHNMTFFKDFDICLKYAVQVHDRTPPEKVPMSQV